MFLFILIIIVFKIIIQKNKSERDEKALSIQKSGGDSDSVKTTEDVNTEVNCSPGRISVVKSVFQPSESAKLGVSGSPNRASTVKSVFNTVGGGSGMRDDFW